MAPVNPAVAAAVASSARGARQKIPRDPAKAPRGQQPTVYPPPTGTAGAVQNAAAATKLPPRLQSAVASGKLTAEQAGQRFEQFKAGKLPGQGGAGMGQTGQSLGPVTADPSMNPGGMMGLKQPAVLTPETRDRQAAAAGGNFNDLTGGGGMEIQSMPMGQGAPFQGGYGAQPGAAAGAADGVGDLARQLPNRGAGAGAAAGQPNPEQLQQLMARLRGTAGGNALNPNGVQPQGRPMRPPGGLMQGTQNLPGANGYGGGLQSMTEVLQGPDGGPMNEKPMPGGLQGVSQNLDQLDGGAMNAKPLFGAQGLPGQEDPIRSRVKNILGGRGRMGGGGGGLQVA